MAWADRMLPRVLVPVQAEHASVSVSLLVSLWPAWGLHILALRMDEAHKLCVSEVTPRALQGATGVFSFVWVWERM